MKNLWFVFSAIAALFLLGCNPSGEGDSVSYRSHLDDGTQGICSRTAKVVQSITLTLQKDCEAVTANDLLKISSLGLTSNEYSEDVLLQLTEEDVEGLDNLRELYLSGNDLTTVPEVIANLTQLQVLTLDGNALITLPDFIGNLVQLQRLDLSGNDLVTLPDWIGNLSQLELLQLNHNNLNALPASIGNLAQLQIFEVFKNDLNVLPASIGNLTQLYYLDISSNNLSALPVSISKLGQLRTLISHGNLEQLLEINPNGSWGAGWRDIQL